jgi:lipoprotein Spr
MMIKKCLVVTLIVLSPSLGLAQNTQTTPSVENQNEFKVEFLNQVMGTALAFNPMSLKLYDFVFDWIGKPYRFGGTSKNGIDCSAFARELYARVMNQYIPRNSRQQFKYVKPIN